MKVLVMRLSQLLAILARLVERWRNFRNAIAGRERLINKTAYEKVYQSNWTSEALQTFDKVANRETSFVVEKAKSSGLDAEPIILKGSAAEKI